MVSQRLVMISKEGLAVVSVVEVLTGLLRLSRATLLGTGMLGMVMALTMVPSCSRGGERRCRLVGPEEHERTWVFITR